MNETVDPHSLEVAEPARRAPQPDLEPAAPQRKRRYGLGRIALVIALALAAVALGLKLENVGISTLDRGQPAPKPSGTPPQAIGAAAAAQGDMPIFINALGAVTPLATVTIRTQISGRLMSVGFEEGQMVKQGDLIAQIDDRPYHATLVQQQAQLAKDTSLHDQAVSDLARYEALSRQDSIAKQQVDDQRFLVAQDAAAMQIDQAQIDATKLNIDYCHITSPINGRVGLRQVDPGNYVQPTDTAGLVVITELDPISVVFSTPEDNLPRITKRVNAGEKLIAEAYDRANVKKLADGELTTYDNVVDTTTGTFKLRATFANPGNALFPSQFVNVRLLVDTMKGVVLVPNAAIQIGTDGSYVYLLNDDSTVTVRKVKTGPADAAHTVIENGLNVGDKVVIDGVDRLRDGSKVRVIADAPSSGAAQDGQHKGQGHRQRQQGAEGGSTTPAAAPKP